MFNCTSIRKVDGVDLPVCVPMVFKSARVIDDSCIRSLYIHLTLLSRIFCLFTSGRPAILEVHPIYYGATCNSSINELILLVTIRSVSVTLSQSSRLPLIIFGTSGVKEGSNVCDVRPCVFWGCQTMCSPVPLCLTGTVYCWSSGCTSRLVLTTLIGYL